VGYVYCDNTPAHIIYAMAINNYVPDYDDFYGAIMQRIIPCKWVNSQSGNQYSAFLGYKNVGLGDPLGWKLAHIFGVNGKEYNFDYNSEKNRLFPHGLQNEWTMHKDEKYPYKLINEDISANDKAKMAAHFLRFVHPINFFLVPELKYDSTPGLGIGECHEMQNYVYLYNKEKCQNIMRNFEGLIMPKNNLFTENRDEIGSIKININYSLNMNKKEATNGQPNAAGALIPWQRPANWDNMTREQKTYAIVKEHCDGQDGHIEKQTAIKLLVDETNWGKGSADNYITIFTTWKNKKPWKGPNMNKEMIMDWLEEFERDYGAVGLVTAKDAVHSYLSHQSEKGNKMQSLRDLLNANPQYQSAVPK
jgi:hypothetical protein